MRHSLIARSIHLLVFLPLLPLSARAQTPSDFGTVAVTVRPATAEVFVDGERWLSPDAAAPLVVQLAPGRHTIELRAPGYRSFATAVDVRRGETTPLNVILPTGPARRPPAAPQPDAQPAGPVRQIAEGASDDGFVFAPDFRVTELNHRTTGFAGFYGGIVFGGRVMLGGGGYFQLDDHIPERMGYGGAVAEWRLFRDRPIGLTLHGLAGFGEARTAYVVAFDGRPTRPGPMRDVFDGHGIVYGGYDGFFVAEPQAQVVARFGGRVRLVGGVGYRVTSASSSNLDGVSGSISIQFGR
jgi:hypothetical protein